MPDKEIIILILRIALGALLLLSIIGWMLYLKKTEALHTAKTKLVKGVKKRERERLRQERKEAAEEYSEKKKGFAGLIEKSHKRFVYSGLDRKLKNVGFLYYLIFKLFVGILGIIIAVIVSKNAMYGIIAGVLLFAGMFLYENILVLSNHNKIDRELIKMMNLIGAFSETKGKITIIFGEIADYLDAPLNYMLKECYYDAQTSADENLAMQLMIAKTGHKKFKEVIKNIQICSDYSPNFKNVIEASKESLLTEQKLKRERMSLARDSSINIVIVSLLLVVAVMISGNVIGGVDIVHEIFGTPLGLGVVLIWIIAYSIFIGTVINTEKG